MGHIDGGDSQPALELLDNRPHLYPELCVQVGQGLIHQQYAGLYDKGPCKGHPLLLSS